MRPYIQVFIFCLSICQLAIAQNWQPLFNEKDLEDFIQLGGKAKYSLQNGVIVGEAIFNSPNSFLATKKTYGDFILEFDVFLDSDLNSGVQIRSNSNPDYRNGVVHGYQVELDPSSRAWTGGIYDEQRRGWLYPLTRNAQGQMAYKHASWNTFRIEAIGNSINVWVNGIQTAHLRDDVTSEGFIGLQVHSISEASGLEGVMVKWRNLRIMTQDLVNYSWRVDPSIPQFSYLKNELTEWEKRKGFRLLWDAESSKGWRGAKLAEFPESGWSISDGVLTVEASDGGESTGGGDIFTRNTYSDFELELEFKITEGANSGIKYFVDPELNKGPGSAIGCEFQILDDRKHPDAKMGVNGNRTVGSLYDLITAENLSEPRPDKRFNGIGKWNKARIVSKNGRVEHWLNNIKVVEYDRNSQMFRSLVAYSKYKNWDQFGQWPEGHILLQDHGNEVSFRSIKIREL